MHHPSGIRPIDFCRTKYGVPLLADVADVSKLRGFIQGTEPHVLRFYELMFVTGGAGKLALDGERHDVAEGATLVTRPGEVRRWELRAPLQAVALFFEPEFVHGFFADASFLGVLDAARPAEGARIALPETPRSDCFATLATMMSDLNDVQTLRLDSDHLLRAGLYRLLVSLNRHARTPREEGAVKRAAPDLARAFRSLVDQHFRDLQRVADYARLLGVTPEHLSRTVTRRAGLSPSEVIQRRLLLEAKRRLLYTNEAVGAIADSLNFSDRSYFNRFFRRCVGVTPRQYRSETPGGVR